VRIGSQNLTPGIKPGAPQGPVRSAGAGGPGVARDALALSGGGVKDGLKSLKDSVVHLFDWLLGRDEAPQAPVAAPPKADAPVVTAPAPTPRPQPKPQPRPETHTAPAPAPVPGVREKAESLWFAAHSLTSSFRTGRRDAHDVNVQDGGRDRQARELIAANGPMEAERLAALGEPQRHQYQVLATALGDRPQARLALQVLLADGKLTGKPAADGQNLLQTLHGISHQAFTPGVDKTDFLSELVHEIAVPSAINQQDKATCTVASVQMLTATNHPAEYARVVAGLASPGGQVRLQRGDTLTREPGTEADDGSARSHPSRLWQAAFMQFAVGPNVDYDNDKDQRDDGKWGIFAPELDKVVDALTARDTRLLTIDNQTPASIVNEIARHANAGKPVPVCMDWGERDASGNEHPGHDILVTAVKDGKVYYDNPWGYQEHMSVEEFKTRVWWANPVEFK
jgi:hypothetical protein